MNITNNLNLPQPIYLAVCGDTYSAGESDISTTSLSLPSRIWALRKLHGEEITTDAADRIYSLLGQIGHSLAERLANNDAYVAEQRFYLDVDGVKIGGQIDLYDKQAKTLYDYKLCSYWVSKEGVKPEWTEQANVNMLLLKRNGLHVERATYIAIYRDWSKTKAGIGDMPLQPVQQFTIETWPEEQTMSWIRGRIASHQGALATLPECSEEDRWAKAPVYAVHKTGRKSAVKLFDDEAGAQQLASTSPELLVVKRQGESIRCKNYCDCRPFCQQAKANGY